MKKLSILLTVLVGSMCVFQSCKKNNNEEIYQIGNQEFILYASSCNNLEIVAGEIAVSKGQSDTVKAFAAHMIAAYTSAEAELAAFAASKSLGVAQRFFSHHANNLNILSQVTTQLFDRRYAELMVISHQEKVNLYQLASQANGVPDAAIRNWAAGKLPGFQLLLAESQALYARENP